MATKWYMFHLCSIDIHEVIQVLIKIFVNEIVKNFHGVDRDSPANEYGKLSTKSRENMYSDHTATILNMLLLDSLYY